MLDLGLRNSLLNYHPLKSRGVEVTNELPAEVFRILVREGKTMSFLPVAEEDDQNESPQLLLDQPDEENIPEGELVANYTDLHLQTDLPSAKLQSKLLATFYAARTYIEEQGVSILFLALGLLDWYEDQSSQERHRAPLILIPVELSRSDARARFHLNYTGEDIGPNLSLVEKLKVEFGISLPSFPEGEDLNVVAYFNEVTSAVRPQPRWSVDQSAIALGFFSFGKFLMYHDLDASIWSQDSLPTDHPIIKALLQDGFHEEAIPITEKDQLDQHLLPDAIRQVMSADSTQILAILDANNGRNLVIQGPPGTGKSQTITNLIAEAIGRGKSVLFVSEKMAALEVVKRRLDSVGLGEACLELHSHKANKKALLNELARTINLGQPRLNDIEDEINLLKEARDRLNLYCEAVNTPISKSGVTPHRAFGEMAKLKKKRENLSIPQLELQSMVSWTGTEFKRRNSFVEEIEARLAVIGVPERHAFWGSRRTVLLPTEQNRLAMALEAGERATRVLGEAAAKLSLSLQLANLPNRGDAEVLCRAARRAMQAPHLHGVKLSTGEWQARQDDLHQLLAAGLRFSELHRQYDEILIPGAWDQNLLETRQQLAVYGHKWWKFLSGTYRQARNKLAGLCQTSPPRSIQEKLQLIDAVLEAQRQRNMIRQYESMGSDLFGAQWQGESSDWPVLSRLFKWILELYRDIGEGQLPQGIIDFLAGEPNLLALEPEVAAVESALQAQLSLLLQIVDLLELDETRRFGPGLQLADQSFTKQEDILKLWSQNLDDLQDIVSWNNLSELCQKDELGPVTALAESWPEARDQLVNAFRYVWFESLLEMAFRERSALRLFDRTSHEEAIKKFRLLDGLLIEYNRAKLAHDHWQQLPQHNGGGQLGVLRREFEKKKRHIPIRKLMLQAGHAIQAIKPVFMMGPMSIATYLAPGSLKFDVVIFDEASQVKPVDAFGAILRGQQGVVVGDSKQLPPTNFFDSLIKEEDLEEENVTSDIESILGLFVAQGAPQRMLRWHYRSRHESLIAVSNHEFYEDRLVVFPSPDASRERLGLVFHHLPETGYDRGKTRTNPKEAEEVARAVMAHARAQLEHNAEEQLTLGVAAFSVAQMQAILDQIELLRRQDPSCEEFFSSHPHEPFFVKNLENVQGDERDVIFISVGYGRTAEGYVSMSFGPVNSDGGERRLNVLISRARVRCEVFTNLTSDDIDLNRTNARGVRALKTFLKYAQTGILDVPVVTGKEPDSPFEESVLSELNALGYEVKTQVGSAGFYIDLAVVDSDRRGRYLLGIECDGAAYHSARSARDRDRLREEVLRGLGWRIHRIWSTDWFRNQERELKRLVAAIEEARVAAAAGDHAKHEVPKKEAAVIERESTDEPPESGKDGVLQYRKAEHSYTFNEDLLTTPVHVIASWVVKIVNVESPVHVNEVARRIADAANTKLGIRIKTRIDWACREAVNYGEVFRRGEFLWARDMRQPVLRERSKLPASSRKVEFISPEEIALAIEKVVSEAYGIEPEKIPSAVCRLFGFMRVTDEMHVHVISILNQCLKGQRLKQEGSHVTLA